MKRAKETREDIDERIVIGWESQVGSQEAVINGKVLKMVVIRITNCDKRNAGSQGSLEAGIVEVNKLLQKEAIS